MIEQAVQHIGRFAFGRADRQDAEIAVLIGKMAVEFGARFAAIMQVDIASASSPVPCPEKLPVGGRGDACPQRLACGCAELASVTAAWAAL